MKQSPYMTMRQNTLSEHENADLALLKNWDQQKTMPVHNRPSSSKKRKSESKKSDRKSDRKNKKSMVNAHGKSVRYDTYKQNHQYNQSLGAFMSGTQNSLQSASTMMKNPMYSTTGSQNISSHSTTCLHSKNMKAQLSKKLIKNFVNTHRENENLITKLDIDKERTVSNDKKLNTYRKSANSKEKKADCKRPKSSVEASVKNVTVIRDHKVPASFHSPDGTSEEPRAVKPKVKVYRVDKEQIMNKSDDKNSKHLKSKSQSNFMSTTVIDNKNRNIRNTKARKSDIYAQNFSSTDYYKQKDLGKSLSLSIVFNTLGRGYNDLHSFLLSWAT